MGKAVVAAIALAALVPSSLARAQPVPSAQQDLNNVYETLTPYGVWVEMDPWGLVWKPDVNVVGSLFYPYLTRGHWMHTAQGWAWASDFEWGWLTFHYGRWLLAADYGWAWVPDTNWAPAWVDWRIGDTYVGWMPKQPEGTTPRQTPSWAFVPLKDFTRRDLVNVRVPFERQEQAYTRTADQGYELNDPRRGPDPRLIQRAGECVPQEPLGPSASR
jgi:hypothetical protein